MGLGLMTGKKVPGGSVDENYAQVQRLVEQFEEKFRSINCQGLTGCHLGTEAGQASFRENNQVENCLTYVEAVTQMALDLVNE